MPFLATTLRPDFTSNLVRELAFGTPQFYTAPYGKINHELINLSSNYDVKSGLRATEKFHQYQSTECPAKLGQYAISLYHPSLLLQVAAVYIRW